jgi:hypothetical protein
VTWQATMRIEARVGDLVRRIGDDQAQVGYSVVRRSGGWLTLCVIHIVHVEETRSASFLVQPQNRWRWFVSGLTSKPVWRFLDLGLKTKVDGLMICASKSPR